MHSTIYVVLYIVTSKKTFLDFLDISMYCILICILYHMHTAKFNVIFTTG